MKSFLFFLFLLIILSVAEAAAGPPRNEILWDSYGVKGGRKMQI